VGGKEGYEGEIDGWMWGWMKGERGESGMDGKGVIFELGGQLGGQVGGSSDKSWGVKFVF